MTPNSAPVCISVINLKGGVGKTTIAALLSRYAALRLNRQVLAIDLDPQANLSQALMGERSYRQFLDAGAPSIAEVFAGYQPPGANSLSAAPLNVSDVVRGCRQKSLLQIITARSWQMAKYDAVLLEWRVATPRHCLNSRNPFSTRCRSLYSARS